MHRIALIHWNEAEAKEHAQRLRRAGYAVAAHTGPGSDRFRALLDRPPAAVVIDLSRLPSQGLGAATWLRQRKATRSVPLVFIEGDPEKTARVRSALPDAEFTTWRRIRGALRRALTKPVAEPRVPGTMDGYSGTPLPKKLGIKAGSTVTLLGAPDGFETVLRPLPKEVVLRKSARGRAAVVVLFARTRAELSKRFPAASRAVEEGGRLWLCWPKQASGAAHDLTPAWVRRHGMDRGFVDYKICAVDGTWSGLCFARRRSGEART